MHTIKLKLVTIVATRLIADEIVAAILKLGAKGYTATDAHGQGARGLQPLDWEGANTRLETLVSAEVAERIIGHLSENYFAHHGVIAFQQDVEVVRGEKYL